MSRNNKAYAEVNYLKNIIFISVYIFVLKATFEHILQPSKDQSWTIEDFRGSKFSMLSVAYIYSASINYVPKVILDG